MKKYFVAVVLFLLAIFTGIPCFMVEYVPVARVGELRYVTILNDGGIQNGNGHLEFLMDCVIKPKKELRLVLNTSDFLNVFKDVEIPENYIYRTYAMDSPDYDEEQDLLLVEYYPHEQGYGATCGSGTLFLMGEKEFSSLTRNELRWHWPW